MHSMPDFPVSMPAMIIWAVILLAVTIGFIMLLIRLNRKGKRLAIVGIFALLLILGTAIHVVLLARSSHTVTDGNWIQLTLVSMVAGLEMFIGHTVVFDDIIAAVIFREPGLMIAYISIFVLIITFTLSMVMLVIPRRLKDRIWLARNAREARKNRKNHIFLGLDVHSKVFAGTILKEWEADKEKSDQGNVILVEFPEAAGHKSELSIGELITNIFGRQRALSLEKQLGSNKFVLLKGHMPEGENADKNLCCAIGLEGLSPWLANPRTTLYVVSPNEDSNMKLLKYLTNDPALKAKVMCYSNRMNSYTSLMAAMGDRIRILNLPEMSFNEIKQNRLFLHPVHYANMARDAKGQPLGYVKSPSTSLIIGFGETGQEGLRYLYEFGSFVGKDLEPVQNTYKVYDPNINSIKGDFLTRTPALRYGANIEWSSSTMGTSQFWLEYAMMLPSLSYAIIAVGKSVKNVEMAVQLLQEAARYGKDLSKLCILVGAHEADENMLELIDFYNRSYCPEGVAVIHPFGLPGTIWNLDVTSGKSLKKKALECAPSLQTGDPKELWRQRSESIRNRGGNELLNRQELHRKQFGDISRSLFTHTLIQLCPAATREIAADIPDTMEDGEKLHYKGDKANYSILEYLAATEHLHWMHALEAAGYIDGAGKQDELNKRILNLVPYPLIPTEQARHLCWLAVKAALVSKLD